MPSQLYLTDTPPEPVEAVRRVFSRHGGDLAHDHVAKVVDVLGIVRADLEGHGWTVAAGGRKGSGITLPTSGGPAVRADATRSDGFALWIETGRSWNNNGFLHHLAEGIRSPSVSHPILAIVSSYKGQNTYERCEDFLADLLASDRLTWPFKSVTLVGF